MPSKRSPARPARGPSRGAAPPTGLLVSTTLAGPGAENTIGNAIGSVAPCVDVCLVLETTDGPPSRLEGVCRRAAGKKLRIVRWAWRNDFAAARNAALRLAAEVSPKGWAITVDADERIEPNGEDLHATLAATTAPAVYMAHSSGTYWQPRAIRLPAAAAWSGRVHEAIALQGPRMRLARFGDNPKTPEELRVKFERDVAILREETAAQPANPRWHYYLGDALAGLGKAEEAILSFRRCAELRGWDEESAWACYRAADLLSTVLGKHNEAAELCAFGLSRHAGIAELAWFAGLACYRMGNMKQAARWARLAKVHDAAYVDKDTIDPRILFRVQKGLREGPADVLRFALRDIGDPAGASRAESEFQSMVANAPG